MTPPKSPLAAVSVRAFAPSTTAPLPLMLVTPVPAALTPAMSKVPLTTTPLDAAMEPAPVRAKVPDWMFVLPVYVLATVSAVVPLPTWITAPDPEMMPPKATASDRLKASVPLSLTSPTIEPELPPLPSCRVPAEMVVPPV
jgi:hypothetical protein